MLVGDATVLNNDYERPYINVADRERGGVFSFSFCMPYMEGRDNQFTVKQISRKESMKL